MQRILFVLIGVLVVAAAAVTAFFALRAPPSADLPGPPPVDAPASASAAPASQ